jgi:hypothetical protein
MASRAKIVSMFTPVGAILEAIKTAWAIYTFLRDNIGRIWGVVQAVLEGVGQLARGVWEPVANLVEQQLARLVPIAISLLANLLGVGGITQKVREIIERIRATVRNAIVAFLRRVIAMFRGPRAAADAAATPGEAIVFTVDGEEHRLFLRRDSAGAEPMVASRPMTVTDRLAELAARVPELRDIALEQRATVLIQQARALEQKVDSAADRRAAQRGAGGEMPAEGATLAGVLAELYGIFHVGATPLTVEFDAGDEHHTLKIEQVGGALTVLMASDRFKPLRALLAQVEKEIEDPDDSALGAAAIKKRKDAIKQALGLTTRAETAAAKVDANATTANLRAALGIEAELAAVLATIFAGSAVRMESEEGNPKFLVWKEDVFAMEGLTGRYGEMPEPKSDLLTPDHQPAAELFVRAAQIEDAGEPIFKGTKLARIAATGHAQGAWVINIAEIRHKEGLTWGSKVKPIAAKFFTDAEDAATKARTAAVGLVKKERIARQRTAVVNLLKAAAQADATRMRTVISSRAFWTDVYEVITRPQKRTELIKELRTRIGRGLDRMIAQNFNELKS